jgi:hypothetical protein
MITREEELERSHPHDNNGYNHHGCRGPICRQAHALAALSTREERRAYVAEFGLPEHVKHGASAYTNWGCRCHVCKEGHAEECSRYRV